MESSTFGVIKLVRRCGKKPKSSAWLARSKRSKLAGRFTPKDIDELLSAVAKTGKVDILALHENPNYCNDKRGEELYRTIVKAIQPQVIFCGHMHISLREEFAGIPLIGIGQKEKVLQYEFLIQMRDNPLY